MSDAGDDSGRPRAVRFIFEYDGDDVRLVSQQRVDIAVTGFDLSDVRPPGHYVELRGADGETLTAVPARNAMRASVEVFPEQPGEPITRINLDRPQGAFTVVTPTPTGAVQVAVVELTPSEGGPIERGLAPPPPEVRDVASFAFEPEG